ncbi:MAG: PhoH family protein [Chitinivibrionales bacterium]
MSRKTYILDSTVLLHDPGAMFSFEDNDVIIPFSVIDKIEHFKKELSEKGKNARTTAVMLDDLRSSGSLNKGIHLENGGIIRVMNEFSFQGEEYVDRGVSGGDILNLALSIDEYSSIIVTKNISLRIKADSLSLHAEDYQSDKIPVEELYSGSKELESITYEELLRTDENYDCYPNQYVSIKQAQAVRMARYSAEKKAFLPLIHHNTDIQCRITPRNDEQSFALDALLEDSIDLVTLAGKAGTGKTLLCIAAGLYKTVDENKYNRVLISRPTLPMGHDIGYLPGSVEEKLSPWMYPIVDNVEFLMRSDNKRRRMRSFEELVEMGILLIEPLTYIRGRSIHNRYLIVDEAQNLTPHEVKTVITRAGEGTKIILTGDPYQIDNPYVDSSSNGLTQVVERFKDQKSTAHITMTKGERSHVSEMAANIL